MTYKGTYKTLENAYRGVPPIAVKSGATCAGLISKHFSFIHKGMHLQ